jgi:hypothetical protein
MCLPGVFMVVSGQNMVKNYYFFSLKQTNLIFEWLEVTKILSVEATRRVCLFMRLDHDFESFWIILVLN